MATEHWENAQLLLNQGHISHAELENHTIQRITAQQQLKLAERDSSTEQANIASLTHELATLPQQQANELASFENTYSDLKQQIVSHKSNYEETIYAPHSGYISGLHVKAGYTVDSSRPLLTLLPKDADILHLSYNYIPKSKIPFIITCHGNGQIDEHFPDSTVFVSKKHAQNHGSPHYVYNGLDFTNYPLHNHFNHKNDWNNFLFLAKAMSFEPTTAGFSLPYDITLNLSGEIPSITR